VAEAAEGADVVFSTVGFLWGGVCFVLFYWRIRVMVDGFLFIYVSIGQRG
jgi:hypothetical protein